MNPVLTIYNRQRKFEVTDGLKDMLSKCCEAVLKCENFFNPAEVDLTFVSLKKIREYNRDYRGIDRITDVLSFPLGENGVYAPDPESGRVMLGDIIISLERAKSQSEEYGHSFEREVGFLTVHSMLHLLGYDHMQESDGDIMRAHEKKALEMIGLKR